MRVVQDSQIQLGELSIAQIRIDPRSRDDIPAVLRALQEIYTHDEKREQLFALLEEILTSKTRHTTGRPGMHLWRIFVLATLKAGASRGREMFHNTHSGTSSKALANRSGTVAAMQPPSRPRAV